MGVKGLWQLVAPVGRPISMESLDGKVLAIDVSIWLNKALKGMRDKCGNEVFNAHLVLVFHRICKMLFYGIKPVFVFDGGVPELKKKTLKARRRQLLRMVNEKLTVDSLTVQNFLKRKALETVTGVPSSSTVVFPTPKGKEEDLFQLEPLNTEEDLLSSSSDEDLYCADPLHSKNLQRMLELPESIDFESEEFTRLPIETKHELLLEIKQRYRRPVSAQKNLPQESLEFSNYQLSNLMRNGKITHCINSVRKEMKNNTTLDLLTSEQKSVFRNQEVKSNKIASNDSERYVLIKSIEEKNSLFDSRVEDAHMAVERIHNKAYNKIERVPIKFRAMKSNPYAGTLQLSEESSDDDDDDDDDDEIFKESHKGDDNILNEYQEEDGEGLKDSQKDNDICKDSKEVGEEKNEEFQNSFKDEVAFITTTDDDSDMEVTDASSISRQMSEPTIPDITSFEDLAKHEEFKLVSRVVSFDSREGKIFMVGEKLPNQSFAHQCGSSASLNEIESTASVISTGSENKIIVEEFKVEGDCHGCFEDATKDVTSNFAHEDAIKFNDESSESDVETYVGDFIQTAEKREHLVKLAEDLEKEESGLRSDAKKKSRQAAKVAGSVYTDVQALLQLFGIPYIVSPMEAEAQCAALDALKLTDGTITDDSDVFLFGAETVFKNFFNKNKLPEKYLATDIQATLYLTRERLIAVAFLAGSDYTEGITGVGGVTAMEILQAFDRQTVQKTLQCFKDWLKGDAGHCVTRNLLDKLKSKLRPTDLPSNYNSTEVWQAYLNPIVDASKETFEWGVPDMTAIEEYAREKMAWSSKETKEILKPVLDRQNSKRKSQKTMEMYFSPKIRFANNRKAVSRRVQHVLNRFSNTDEPANTSASMTRKTGKKRLRGKRTHISNDNLPPLLKVTNVRKAIDERLRGSKRKRASQT